MVSEFRISKNHPSLSGHFPGNPVVPGVIILDKVIYAASEGNNNYRVHGFTSVKFFMPLKPEEKVNIIFTNKNKCINFECLRGSTLIASGNLQLEVV